MVTNKNLKFFYTFKDTHNTTVGFRFVALVVLEILGGGGGFNFDPPWCMVRIRKPLVSEGLRYRCRNGTHIWPADHS